MAIRKTKPGVQDGDSYRDGAGTEQHDGDKYDQEHRTYDELARGGRAMAKHEKKESKAEEKREERARGGGVKAGGADGDEGAGKPEYFGGAESPSARAARGDREAKEGGRVKRKRKERKAGGRVEGHAAHKRLDRAGHGGKKRAMGGRMAGADSHPLTEANKLERPKGDKGSNMDNEED